LSEGDQDAVDVREHDRLIVITVAFTAAEAVAVIRHAESASEPAARAAVAILRYILVRDVRVHP